jgi:hypothetical protein
MIFLRRIFIILLSTSLFLFQTLYHTPTVFAGVTSPEPQVVTSKEYDISDGEAKGAKASGGKWLWAILGVALIGGLAAAVAGGGGDDGGGGGGGDDDGDGTGGITGSW